MVTFAGVAANRGTVWVQWVAERIGARGPDVFVFFVFLRLFVAGRQFGHGALLVFGGVVRGRCGERGIQLPAVLGQLALGEHLAQRLLGRRSVTRRFHFGAGPFGRPAIDEESAAQGEHEQGGHEHDPGVWFPVVQAISWANCGTLFGDERGRH